jgi:hypothetical protein
MDKSFLAVRGGNAVVARDEDVIAVPAGKRKMTNDSMTKEAWSAGVLHWSLVILLTDPL